MPRKKTPVEPAKKKYYSPEERKRRSEMAKKLYEEGKFGGANLGRKGGLTPKKTRASRYIRERAQRNPAQLWRALAAGLESPDPETQRKSAMSILEVERREDELSIQEQLAFEKMRPDELIDRVVNALGKLGSAGKLPPGLPILEARLTAKDEGANGDRAT